MSHCPSDQASEILKATLRPGIDRGTPARRPGCRKRRALALMLLVASAAVVATVLPAAAPFDQTFRVSAEPETWTFMVYLDGDNDLEDVAIDDFLEMASVDSSSRLNIVVQFDRYVDVLGIGDDQRYGDWTTCKRFLVDNEMTPLPANALMDIGEVDMGDPATLIDFLNWALTSYPADRYALVIWDHGASWYGCCWDYTDGFSAIRLDGLREALRIVREANDFVVYDILAFDACSMCSIEVAYDMQDYADYMMASEIWVPDDGLNYSSLQAIVDDPYITPAELCSRFLVDYAEYYYSLEGTPKQYMLDESFSMSVVDLDLLDPVVDGMGVLSSALIERLRVWRVDIAEARNMTEDYNGSLFYDAVDIRHMCEVMQTELPPDSDVEAVLAGLISSFDACVVDHICGTNPENCLLPIENTHGLAVNYPAYGVFFDKEYLGDGLSLFTDTTQWDEFLACSVLGYPCVCIHMPVGSSVATNAVMEVWISEPIDTSEPYSIQVYPTALGPGYPIPGAITWDGIAWKLTFTPADALLPFTDYTVSVSAADLQGLTLEHDWTFFTGEEIPEFGPMLLPATMLLSLLLAMFVRLSRRR